MKYPDLSPKIMNAEWKTSMPRPKSKQIEELEKQYHEVLVYAQHSGHWRKRAYWYGQVAQVAARLEKLANGAETVEPYEVPREELGINAAQVLSNAAGHLRDRAATYDKPEGERSMEKTVQMFNLYSGHSLTTYQGWRFMQILKMVRADQGQPKLDNHEDEAAYVGLAAEAKFQEKP